VKPNGTAKRALSFLLSAILFFLARSASAHKPSDSYLSLKLDGARVVGHWDIALRDLDNALSLDTDGDGNITWGELRAREGDISSFAFSHLGLTVAGAKCPITPGAFRVASHSDGTYAAIDFVAACTSEARAIDVDYELFFDVDPQHDGIVRLDDGAQIRSAIFTSKARTQHFERENRDRSHELGSAVKLGIFHIFSGIDHLLFLIALLIPAVLVRKPPDRIWQPVDKFKPALVDVLKIVTAFTLAHSITLTLSALEVLRLPSRFVESGIAASVILAAANNVFPVLEDDRWTAAFALGLLHGFGFSATLMDLGLPRENLVLTLFGFNLGVEIGQMCVVGAFLPLAFLARRTLFYRKGMLVGGSIVIAVVASIWLTERAFAIKIF
jgi:hypothetical protein